VEDTDTKLTVTKELEEEILESIYQMVNDLDLAGIRRMVNYTKNLDLSSDTVSRIEELVNAIDAGNIKVANQLANHSRT
jgi:hypothetical protein